MQPGAVESPASGVRTDRQRIFLLVVVVLGHAVKHVYNAAFFILLPELKLAMGLSNAGIGTISTVRNIAGGVANVPAGFLADRFRRQWALTLGLSLAVVGLFHFLVGSADSLWLLALGASGVGIAITFYHPPAIATLSQRFAARRGLAIAIHGSGGSVGEALGPLLVGGLLAYVAWDTVFRASALPAVAAGVTVWLLLRGIPVASEETPALRHYVASVGRLVRNRRILVVLLVTGGFSMTQSAVVTFLPIYLRIDLDYSALVMAAHLSAAQVIGIVSQPALGYLSDTRGRKAVLVPSLLALSATVLGLALAPPGWPLLLNVAAMGAFSFPLMALFLASAMDVAGEGVQATTVSLVFGSAILFSGVSPYLSGLLADAYGVKAAFLFAAAFALFAAVLALALDRTARRDAAPHA